MRKIMSDYVKEHVEESLYREINNVQHKVINDASKYIRPLVEPANYPNTYLQKMMAYVSAETRNSAAEMLHSFGKFTVINFKRDFPGYFKNYTSAKPFLKAVSHLIYVELRNLYIDSTLPELTINEINGTIFLEYNSERKLCDFLSGLIEGIGEIFEEKIEYRHIQCMKHGKEKCILELDFCS